MKTYRRSLWDRYKHANQRLLARYGVGMDFEEYLRQCDKFSKEKRDGGSIRGLRVQNEHGDLEGWIKVKGKWVCAHYKLKDKLIATFLPMPLTSQPCPKCGKEEE